MSRETHEEKGDPPAELPLDPDLAEYAKLLPRPAQDLQRARNAKAEITTAELTLKEAQDELTAPGLAAGSTRMRRRTRWRQRPGFGKQLPNLGNSNKPISRNSGIWSQNPKERSEPHLQPAHHRRQNLRVIRKEGQNAIGVGFRLTARMVR